MRVVLDTNVLISAFLWQKGLKPIYQAIRSRKITPWGVKYLHSKFNPPCFTQKTWSEILRALSYSKFEKQLLKINISPKEITKLLLSRAYFVISYLRLAEIKEDPSDNYILAAALACGCSFIVSGDKHLLKLKQFQDIPILTPKVFIQRFLK